VNEIGDVAYLLLRVRTVRDRGKPGRLDETHQIGRNRHVHFVSSAQQLHTDRGAGFDIAARSVGC
jgi:hypothetical protein